MIGEKAKEILHCLINAIQKDDSQQVEDAIHKYTEFVEELELYKIENKADQKFIKKAHNHIKKLESDNNEMLECLKEVLEIQYKNAMRCGVLKIPEDNIQQVQYIIEKITGKPIEEVLEDGY